MVLLADKMKVIERIQDRRAEEAEWKQLAHHVNEAPLNTGNMFLEKRVGDTINSEAEHVGKHKAVITDRYHSEKAVISIVRDNLTVRAALIAHLRRWDRLPRVTRALEKLLTKS